MAVQLIYGRSGCGKTGYITECIRSRHNKNKKSVLLVPEQYTHIAEHKLLSALGSISPSSAEVTSFNKMINRMESEYGIVNVLPPMTKNIIMADILSDINLEYFDSSRAKTGFADMCLGLVSELKKYCITPEMLCEANEDNPNKRLQLKIDDIVKVYEEYIRRAGENGFDSGDGATVLADKIAEADLYGDTCFFFDEFTSFIPQELEIIKQIALKAEDVYITLCTDGKDDTLFAPVAYTAQKIISMCRESGITVKDPVILKDNHKHKGELAFMETNLLPYPSGKYDDDCENISIFSAKNPYAEAEDTARRIVSLCRDGGYRYRDIAVVCSETGVYAPVLKNVFERHGIPSFIDEKSPAASHRIVLCIMNIIDVYLEDYSRRSVFAFLKSGLCKADMDSVYALENYCLTTNMHKSTWLDDTKWSDLLLRLGIEGDEAQKICSIRDNFIVPLSSFHNSIKGRHKVADMCKALYGYLVDIGLPEIIEEYLKLFEKANDINHGEEYERIWSIIVDALDALVDVVGEKTVNVKNFRNLLQTAFSGYSIGIIPTALDEVVVGDISRSRMDGIKVLFVLGANDGIFPASASADGIINDDDKLILAQKGVELSADSKTRAFYERFAMYSTFTIPSEKLFISFSRSGSDGQTIRPSFVLADFKRIFPDLVTESDVMEDKTDFGQMEYITTQTPTLEKMIEKITAYRDGEDVSHVWLDVYEYFCREMDFGTKLKKYYSYNNLPKDIDSDGISSFMGDEFYTTVSRLQRYRSCKFSYFLEYILKLKSTSEFNIGAMDVGSFVHSVIERLCTDMQSSGYGFETVTDEYIYKKIDEFIEEFINNITKTCAYVTKRQLYLVKRLRGAIFRCFSLIRNHIADSRFEPLGYEMHFDDNNIGCIEFDLGDGKKVKLTGVIDRSDIYRTEKGDYIRVIDYKTGNKEFKLNDVFYGLDIQLFVYLNALVGSKDNYKYGGALYFRIDDPMLDAKNRYETENAEEKILSKLKMRGLILGEDELIEATDGVTASAAKKGTYKNFVDLDMHLRKTISSLCREMAKGKIDINPCQNGGFAPCDYCDYKSICRFNPDKKGNSYDYITSFKDDEIWEMIGGEDCVD